MRETMKVRKHVGVLGQNQEMFHMGQSRVNANSIARMATYKVLLGCNRGSGMDDTNGRGESQCIASSREGKGQRIGRTHMNANGLEERLRKMSARGEG